MSNDKEVRTEEVDRESAGDADQSSVESGTDRPKSDDEAARPAGSVGSTEDAGGEGDDEAVSENDGEDVALSGAGAVGRISDEEYVYVDPDLEKYGRF